MQRGSMLLLVMSMMFMTAYGELKSGQAKARHAIVHNWLGNEIPDIPNKCGLPALAYAMQHRATLDAGLEASLANVLGRPTLQTSILAGPFRIHFDTDGQNASTIPGYVDSVASIVNYVLGFERDSLGFLPPPSDNGVGGGPEYDIYIQELSGSYYGATTPESPINNKPEGGTWTSFMTIDNDFSFVYPDSNRGLPALRVTLAHELHHAIQMGNYGYWQNEIYFYEMTSVWMEDEVYTGVNDYYQYLRSSQGHFRNPEVSFTSNSLIAYSRGIWCQYLAKRFGREVLRRCWEEIGSARPLVAIDAALQQQPFSTTIRTAFVEWSMWNYFTSEARYDSDRYYPEGRFYPAVTVQRRDFAPPSRVISGSTFPLSSNYYTIISATDTLILFVSNLNTELAQTSNNQSQTYSLLLNQSKIDESYEATNANIFLKIAVPDPTNWYAKDLFGASSVSTVFPNPFIADGRSTVNFPVGARSRVNGRLTILSSSLDLVYAADLVADPILSGTYAFKWQGKNIDGNVVGSGVYFYIIEMSGQSFKGKIAVIRK